jgi:ABC-type polysaccharide/polyol phosphate transport system ATPase subunit
MHARLGFAVATSVDPDILIVDEVLGVGDYKFQAKCIERMNNLMTGGATVLLVSHSMDLIKKMCARAVLLEKGRIVCLGDVDEVATIYGDV